MPVKHAIGFTTALARTVLVPLEESGGRAELVARRLGDAIRVGLVRDGERLPAEAELAAQLGVSTVTLREALTSLRAQGLITTRRGRGGGSFARAPADLGELLGRFSTAELRDLGDQRAAIVGTAARLAAERAEPDEIDELERRLERLRTAAGERRRSSAELMLALAAAAQSPRLTHEEARLRAEVGDLLEPGDAGVLGELVAAVARGDGDHARALAERHVRAETERLIELRHLVPAAGRLEDVAEELERVFTGLEGLGAQFAELVAGGARREDLAPLRATILALIEEHAGLVTGAGVITAPGLLADAPRWLEWWWTGARGGPEALRVNLDPAAPDFYDYTAADWYATPRRTGRPALSGPYVDYACTNEYAVTLGVPCGERGVAAADVLVANLERRVAPALAALGRPVALTNAAGRVIAANTASVVPGQRVDVARATPAPVRSWLLADL